MLLLCLAPLAARTAGDDVVGKQQARSQRRPLWYLRYLRLARPGRGFGGMVVFTNEVDPPANSASQASVC